MTLPTQWREAFQKLRELPQFQYVIARFFEEIGSTNDKVLEEIIRNPKSPLLVVAAAHQIKGRGRRSNSWISSPGHSMLFSFSWKWPQYPEQEFPIALQFGVAVCKAIQSQYPRIIERLWLKWPNDIYLDEQKVGGILIEASQTPTEWIAVLGVGINLISFSSESMLAKGLADDIEPISAPDLMCRILAEWTLFRENVRSATQQCKAFSSLSQPLVGSKVTLVMASGERHDVTFQGVNYLGQVVADTNGNKRKTWPECVSMVLKKKPGTLSPRG